MIWVRRVCVDFKVKVCFGNIMLFEVFDKVVNDEVFVYVKVVDLFKVLLWVGDKCVVEIMECFEIVFNWCIWGLGYY